MDSLVECGCLPPWAGGGGVSVGHFSLPAQHNRPLISREAHAAQTFALPVKC